MALASTLIEIAFRLSIFSLLVYKLYDLGKRYFVPFVDQGLKEEEDKRTALLEKEKLISSTQLRIENQIQRQNQRFITLEKNVQQWHNSMLAYKNQQESESREIARHIHDKHTKQTQRMFTQKNACGALPKALALAQSELMERYAHNRGKQDLTNIIKTMIIKH